MTPRRLLPLLPIAAALIAHSLYFNFVCDDAYISFVYSRNFAEHNELTFNLGDRTEGYTNFLWTLLLGVVMKLGVRPEVSSRVLGTVFAIGTLVVTTRLCERLRGRASAWDYLPAALLAGCSGFACWSSGGLETQLFTFLVVLGITLTFEERWAASGIVLALSAMTRPEGLLVVAVAGVHRVAVNLVERRRPLGAEELRWAGAFLALFAPFFAWRFWYYGWPFPNTFYVKAGGKPPPTYAAHMLKVGFFYVGQWAWQSRAVFALPLVVVGALRHRRFSGLAALLTVAYLGYTIKVGGDFMGLHRFVMPIFVTTAVLAALGFAFLVGKVLEKDQLLQTVAALALVGGFAASEIPVSKAAMRPRADGPKGEVDRPGYLKQYANDRGLIGKALAPSISPDDFAIVGGAGVQPYYARLRGVDIYGLVSEDIAHNEPPVRPRPGHQKWGSPQRILGYDPTLIFYCYRIHRDPAAFDAADPQVAARKAMGLCGDAGALIGDPRKPRYLPVTIYVPGMKEGEYYTFLRRSDRPWR